MWDNLLARVEENWEKIVATSHDEMLDQKDNLLSKHEEQENTQLWITFLWCHRAEP